MSTIAPLTGEEEAGKQGALGLTGHREVDHSERGRQPQRRSPSPGMLRLMYALPATRRIIGCQGSPGSRGVVGLAL